MGFSPASRNRLTDYDLGRYPGATLLYQELVVKEKIASDGLPRIELYEACETARRVPRLFRGGLIVDLAAGHCLLAQLMLILDDTSPQAVAVDTVVPPSAATLHRALANRWPRLTGRVEFLQCPLDSVVIRPTDIVLSIHACGSLTDLVIERAIGARARVAVLPCCHDVGRSDSGGLSGWMDGALAIDVMRARRLANAGYRIWTQAIPGEITPKNRLLIGASDNVPVGS